MRFQKRPDTCGHGLRSVKSTLHRGKSLFLSGNLNHLFNKVFPCSSKRDEFARTMERTFLIIP